MKVEEERIYTVIGSNEFETEQNPTSFSDAGRGDVSASKVNAASEKLRNAELCFL